MIITRFARSRCSFFADSIKVDGTGINNRDVMLVINVIFGVLSTPILEGIFTDTAVKKEVVSVREDVE